jgi:hypothetical protein
MAESAKEQLHIDRCSDSLVASAIPHQSYSLFLIVGFEQTFSSSPRVTAMVVVEISRGC